MSWLKKTFQEHFNEAILFFVFFIVFIVIGCLVPDRFLTVNNFRSMAFQMSEFGFASLGMMAIVLTGGINLSIMSQAALASICGAYLLTLPALAAYPVVAVVLSVLVSLVVAVLTGALNGFFTAYVGVTPILVTLGSMTLFNGIGLNFTKGGAVSGFPEIFSVIGNGSILGFPIPCLLYLLGIVASYFLLERSVWGTRVYMIGCNEVASRFSAINTRKILLWVYIFCGVMAGCSGIIMSSRYNSAKVDYGSSYLMQSIAAVVLGGTRITGGHGTVAGTVIAVCIIQEVSTGLNIVGVNRYIVDIIIGLILLSVLTIQHLMRKFRRLPMQKKLTVEKSV